MMENSSKQHFTTHFNQEIKFSIYSCLSNCRNVTAIYFRKICTPKRPKLLQKSKKMYQNGQKVLKTCKRNFLRLFYTGLNTLNITFVTYFDILCQPLRLFKRYGN